MKKYSLLIFLEIALFFVSTDSFAFSDIGTHPDMTKAAAGESILKNYLKDNLGFKNGLEEIILDTNILTLIANGSQTEDTGILGGSSFRGLNHFYEPLSNTGLNDYCFLWNWTGYANTDWAFGPVHDCSHSIYNPPEETSEECNDFSWDKAREAYYKALTSKNDTDRMHMFARTFRSVGQVVHLVQDMAVPAHVRNDFAGHIEFQKVQGKFIDWFANNLEQYVKDNSTLVTKLSGNATAVSFNKLRDYWDRDIYNGNNIMDSYNNGLAEYTAANFLSTGRMFVGESPYFHPSLDDTNIASIDWLNPELVDAEDGKKDNRIYIKKTAGELSNHLACAGYFTHDLEGSNLLTNLTLYLDDLCHKDYASKLLPQAIGYSAGVMNYFFRGTLEISAPSRFVYSIADGSVIEGGTQHFTYIKAKVKNTSKVGDQTENMGEGQIWAIAKYKKRTNYDPDNMSTDPPAAGDRDSFYSYSVSDPEPVDDELSDNKIHEFEFQFAGDNVIPAGITDLYLQVVYQGTLGTEENTAIAVGMKDLSEPTHFGFYNATDQMYYYRGKFCYTGDCSVYKDFGNIFRTAQKMEDLYPQWDNCENNDDDNSSCTALRLPIHECYYYNMSNKLDCNPFCAYPHDMKVQIAFYPAGGSPADPAHITYNPLLAGRYGRMIILSDNETKHLTAKCTADPVGLDSFPWAGNWPCNYSEFSAFFVNHTEVDIPMVVNQEDAGGEFRPWTEDVLSFRSVRNHSRDFIFNGFSYHQPPHIKDVVWPEMEDPEPVAIGEENINR